MPSTFRRAVRLRSRSEFDRVQRGGRRVSMRLLTLVGFPNALECDRLGIVASRRIGGAVVRNQAKRRIREVFRRQLSQAGSTEARAMDLVVIARQPIAEATYSALETEFSAALRRLRGVK